MKKWEQISKEYAESMLDDVDRAKLQAEIFGEMNLDYLQLAQEVWDVYDSQAYKVRDTYDLFKRLAMESYDEALIKGFTGDLRHWMQCIKEGWRAKPDGERPTRKHRG